MSSNPFAALDEDFGKQKSGAHAPKQAPAAAAAPAPVAQQQPQQKRAPRPSASPAPEGAVDTTDFVQARSEGRGRGGRRGGRGGRGGQQGAAAGGRPPKREFERHSGTGRGREISKGGAGAHNWGKAVEEGAVAEGEAAAQTQQRPPRRPRGPRRAEGAAASPAAEGEAAPAAVAAEGEAVPAAEGAEAVVAEVAAAEKKPEEEEDTGISYAEYLKQQAEKRKALPTKEARKAGEGVVIDSKVNKFNTQLKKDASEDVLRIKTAETAAPAKAAETAAKKTDKNVKLDASEYFTGGISGPAPRDWSEERPRREDRPAGGRGGRGGQRGDRPAGARGGRGFSGAGQQRGPRRQQSVAAPNITDANAFPTL